MCRLQAEYKGVRNHDVITVLVGDVEDQVVSWIILKIHVIFILHCGQSPFNLVYWVLKSDVKINYPCQYMENTGGYLQGVGCLIVLEVPENPFQYFKSIIGMSFNTC